jgi:surface polysaccharide O-acyltransferase-like enzyme
MKNRIVVFDLLKIIACYLVIVNHVGIYLLRYTVNTPFIIFVYSLFLTFCKIAVPLFVMVTGSLLLSRQDSHKKTFKRVFKILVPLVGLSLLLYVYRNGISAVLGFVPSFLQERAIVPFWYLYMLVGLYLVSPFINKMVRNFTDQDHQIFMIVFLIVPSTALLVSKLTGFTLYKEFFTAFFPIVIGYFVAGYSLTKITFSVKQRLWIGFGTLVVLILSTLLMANTSLDKGEIVYVLDNVYLINNVLMSLGVFILVKDAKVFSGFSDRWASIITKIADLTFGIYLIHAFLFPFIAESSISQAVFAFNPILAVIVLELVVFAISAVLILMLKQIPILKNYL